MLPKPVEFGVKGKWFITNLFVNIVIMTTHKVTADIVLFHFRL